MTSGVIQRVTDGISHGAATLNQEAFTLTIQILIVIGLILVISKK